ncbi:HD domain-containing protein [Herpetosiphon llansteffanensis]
MQEVVLCQIFERKLAYIREQALPIDKYSHQPRLYQLATTLGAGLVYDDDVLYAAAWLHDLGVFIGHRPAEPAALAAWDNVAYAMLQVPALLQQWQFPSAKIAAVVAAIGQHSPQQTPTSLEASLLRDADILEQLGAVGILRIVSKVGRDTRYRTFGDALATLEYNLHHLPSQLRLASAQRLAEARIAVLAQFITAAQAEAQGQPW